MNRIAKLALIAGTMLTIGWAAGRPTQADERPANSLGPSEHASALRQRWGFFLDVLDQPLVDVLEHSEGYVKYSPSPLVYAWEVPGETISLSTPDPDGTMRKRAILRWDDARNAIVAEQVGSGSQMVMVRQPDNSYVGDDVGYRRVQYALANGDMALRWEWDDVDGNTHVAQVLHRRKATPDNVAAATAGHARWEQIHAPDAQASARNALYSRYIRAALNDENASTGGWWLSNTGQAFAYALSNGTLTRTTLTAKPGGGFDETTVRIRSNPGKGTFSEIHSGRWRHFRMHSVSGEQFLIERLPADGVSKGKNPIFSVSIRPPTLRISETSEPVPLEYRWVTRKQALHFIAPLSQGIAGSPEQATNRQRWGLLVDLVGREWVSYVPDSAAGDASAWTVYEWAIPGEELRTYYVANGRRIYTLSTRWDPASQRLQVTNAAGEVLSQAEVMGDGSVRYRSATVQGTLRRMADGSFESVTSGTSGTLDVSGRTLVFERTPQGLAIIDAMRARDKAYAREERRQILAEQAARKEAEDDRFFNAMRALNGTLTEANAIADAHLEQTQASYERTLEQARRQAAQERAQASGASDDGIDRQAELANAQQATQRQYEIARQFEARRQAQAAAASAASDDGDGKHAASAVASTGPGQGASTRDDPASCVSAPEIGPNPNPAICTDGYSASVTNGCTAAVKIRLCAMTAKGWDCSKHGGLEPGRSWSQAWCHAQPGTFVSSRYADSPQEPDRP